MVFGDVNSLLSLPSLAMESHLAIIKFKIRFHPRAEMFVRGVFLGNAEMGLQENVQF